MIDNYKLINGYEDYIIFRTGKVYSLRRKIFKKYSITRNGYKYYSFWKNGFNKVFTMAYKVRK